MSDTPQIKKRFNDSQLVANWYEVKQLRDDLYLVDEQDHTAFFIIKDGDYGYFFDSGLGLSEEKANELLDYLEIESFEVIATHTHCDHSGLNYMADNVSVLEEEWDKYQEQGEVGQIKSYCEMIGSSLPWPVPKQDLPTFQNDWFPTQFIDDGQVLQLGDWQLEVMLLPGHTRGHAIFIERKKDVIFLGDFVVSGTNYIHLKDSSVQDYFESVEKLNKVLQTMEDGTLLLACHDQIPLEKTYIKELSTTLEKIDNREIEPRSTWESSEIFREAWIYDTGTVRLAIRKDQLE